MLNHHSKANVWLSFDDGVYERTGITAVTTLTEIAKGIELFVSYGDDWFEGHGIKNIESDAKV